MIKKRLLSILLSCCMMLTLLPTAVFAESGGVEATQCVCETACTAEQMNTECPVCGAADAAPEDCGVEATQCVCETACTAEQMNTECPVCGAADAAPDDCGVEATQCVCETACTAEQMNTECPVCGAADAAPENCGKYISPEGGNADWENGNNDPVGGAISPEDETGDSESPPEQDKEEYEAALILGDTVTNYQTVTDAMTAAQNDENSGCTVKLLKNVSLAQTLFVKKGTLTLDLAGFYLAGSFGASRATVRLEKSSTADLTIMDSRSETGTGYIENNTSWGDSSAVLAGGGKLTIESGRFLNGLQVDDKAQVKINGGLFVRIRPYNYEWGANAGGFTVKVTDGRQVHDLLREGCELYYAKEDRFVNCRVAKMQFEEELILRAHPKHNSDENGKCDCGFICPHKEFQDGVCTSCGTAAFLMLTDSTGAETKYFVTLSDAFNAVPKKSDTDTVYTVTVLASRKPGSDWTAIDNKRLTLDLGGQTLSDCRIQLKNKAELTLTGSGAMNDGSHIEVYGECKLYVKNGTVDSVSVLSATSGSNGTVYLQGGTIGLTLRLGGDAVLTGGTLTSLSQADPTAMGMAESVLLGDILPEGYALECADDSAEKLPRSTGIKKNDSLRRTMHVVYCDHGGENAIQDNRCIYCGVKDPFNYDLAKGSIEITVDETGAQTVKQGERITPHTGAVTIMQSGSDTPTTQYSITVTAAAGQTANIILSGVNIDLSATGQYKTNPYSLGEAAMATYGGGNVTVELDGVNSLISGVCRAGLEKHNAGMLTINDSNAVPGSLRAVGFVQSAGIGGNTGYRKGCEDERVTFANANAENITINGGTIEAIGCGDHIDLTDNADFLGAGAGIGGGHGGYAKNITINGGNITARSGTGAGIGSGGGGMYHDGPNRFKYFYGEADNIVVNGGEVTATTISGGAGIGGGFLCTGKNITINNGKVTATGNEGGAGIGGGGFRSEAGDGGNGENITINGGEVIASGGTYRKSNNRQTNGGGAGIGGGGYRDGKNITITGGKVTATGGACKDSGGGAGIGGGGGSNNYGSCSGIGITITGGEILAYGGAGMQSNNANAYTGGAGIGGGGFKSNSGEKTAGTGTDISISNATVTAVGGRGGAGIGGGGNGNGENITIENCKEITATTNSNGAGIGGGENGSGKDITIANCKKVTVTGGNGAGIGGGYNGSGENITIENCNSVNAAGYEGAGIGGGRYGDGRNITIKDSEITAILQGGTGASIGGGETGNGEDITIIGSRVTAYTYGKNGSYGAGIGGGGIDWVSWEREGKSLGNGRRIKIQNSEILTATWSGAGIGGGGIGRGTHSSSVNPDASLGWGNGEDITIINSTVTATSTGGAGIGGGKTASGIDTKSRYDGKGRNITIESSTVTVRTNGGGAGIGGGACGDAENITIESGTVTAQGSEGGAGIGGGGAGLGGGSGIGGNAKGITINGGTVIATGGGRKIEYNDGSVKYLGGAGIGGGGSASYGGGDAEDITIKGGTVIATGGPNATGIGGGSCSVTADSSTREPVFSEEEEGTWIPRLRAGCVKNITINGGTVTAIGQDKASGIGGGGFHTLYNENNKSNQFGEDETWGKYNPQRAAGCAENITITGGYLTVQGGQYGADIGRSEFSFRGRVSTESGLTATGGTFYRSIPANVEILGHVVQYQVGETVSAWQVVQNAGLAYLPRLVDENGVSLDEWYRENEKYDFSAPVTAGLTLTAQTHTCDGWRSDENSHWHYCTDCDKILDKAAHIYGEWTEGVHPTTGKVDRKERVCSVCGYVQVWKIPTPDDPDHTCVYDQRLISPAALKTTGSCMQSRVYYMSCFCGALSSTETFIVPHSPSHGDVIRQYDIDKHWDTCVDCGMIDYPSNPPKHDNRGDGTCYTCDYDSAKHPEHTLIPVPAKEPTCTENGNIAYYACTGCDGTYKNSDGTEFIPLFGQLEGIGVAPIEYGSGVIRLATGHSPANDEWQKGENAHWRLCVCGTVFDRGLHVYDDDSDTTCNTCGYVRTITPTHTHSWSTVWTSNGDYHWHECTTGSCDITDNSQKDGYAAHSFTAETVDAKYLKAAATCTAKAVYYKSCAVCGLSSKDAAGEATFESGELNASNHTSKPWWDRDGMQHWWFYPCCHAENEKQDHVYDSPMDTMCNVCGYVRTIAPTTYTVTLPSGTGYAAAAADGSTSPVSSGESFSFTVTISSGFRKGTNFAVKANGNPLTETDGKYAISNITENQIVTVEGVEEIPPTPGTYTVTFDANGGSVSPASMTTGTDGKLASLPTPTRSSYSFDGWYTEKSSGTKVTTDTVFKNDTTVYAHWTYAGGSGGDGGYTYYTLTFETNGGSTISGERFRSGTTVDLTKYTPTYKGHTFTGWYSDKGLTEKITSIKLDGNRTVYAGWRVEQNPQTGADPFTDVSKSDWFYADVMFVYEKSLMVGTSDTLFSPYGTATRAMMATILWRMEGSPAPKNAPDFTDVASGKWYSDAIAWTTENGIYQGCGNGAFKPDDPITREQLAAIFYRYADYKGYDMTAEGSLDKFKDKDEVSTWAQDAMQWAVGGDLMEGKSNNTLDPQGTAARAEIAAMLHRFIEKYGLVEGKAPGGMTGWIDPKRLKIPRTGDASTLGLWSFTLCASLAGCLALTTAQLRRKREEEALQIIEK